MAGAWGSHLDGTELVWHRANHRDDLDTCFASEVRWVEGDARVDSDGRVRASHEPIEPDHDPMELSIWLERVRAAGRSAKVDLKEPGSTLEEALACSAAAGFLSEDLWFNAPVEIFGKQGIERIRAMAPGARISCPLDTLTPFLTTVGDGSWAILDTLRSWGVDRLSIGVCVPRADLLMPQLRARGWIVNVWDVEDDRDFAMALAMRPDAITADLGTITPPA